MYDTLQKIWVPATVIQILPWNSYQVYTSIGLTHCHMRRHLCECSVKTVDTVPSGTTATLQALTRHCLSAVQPALPHLHHACSPHTLHLQHWQSRLTRSSCSSHVSCPKEGPSTNACDIPCHTCATMKIQLCPHGTKMPDPGNLGTIDLDCPWTLFS